MSLIPQTFMNAQLVEVELPEDVVLIHPEDAMAPQDELALQEFLREFENNHEPLEGVGLFPVDLDE
jgi:hypothetical protein